MAIPTLALNGNVADLVEVECSMTNGLPNLIIVGFANRAVTEARERLRSAFSSNKLALPPKRITINLAPADLPKDSPAYDLALATSVMEAQGLIKSPPPRTMFFGELGLNGDLKPVRGIIGLLLAAQQRGFRHFYLPLANIRQAQLVPDIALLAADNLQSVYQDLAGIRPIKRLLTGAGTKPEPSQVADDGDFAQVIGQTAAKRALAIAAVGHHNVLISGSPGTGKSMLAKALPSILPPMETSEILYVSHLHSLTSHNYNQLITRRPFRSPHHSVSLGALLGGGNRPNPGEISLAHRGVLFLDELPEFRSEALEALRQPLEDRNITIARANHSLTFPADFILVATANPCPCGNFRTSKSCSCLAYDVLRYQQRISGPLMDRIDLYVDADEIVHERLLSQSAEEPSSVIAQRVIEARQLRKTRGQSTDNGRLSNQQVKKFARLSPKNTMVLNENARQLQLSARAYMKVLKVARSIADFEQSSSIQTDHLLEALQYRRRKAA